VCGGAKAGHGLEETKWIYELPLCFLVGEGVWSASFGLGTLSCVSQVIALGMRSLAFMQVPP